MNSDIQPLEWPAGSKYMPSTYRWIFYFIVGIGLVGGIIAGLLYSVVCMFWLMFLSFGFWWCFSILVLPRLIRRAFEPILQQLSSRKTFDEGRWGNPTRAELARYLADLVADEFMWPNGYFIPEDPLHIIFTCPNGGDGGELNEVLFSRIGKERNRIISGKMLFNDDGLLKFLTFGEFVDWYLAFELSS